MKLLETIRTFEAAVVNAPQVAKLFETPAELAQAGVRVRVIPHGDRLLVCTYCAGAGPKASVQRDLIAAAISALSSAAKVERAADDAPLVDTWSRTITASPPSRNKRRRARR